MLVADLKMSYHGLPHQISSSDYDLPSWTTMLTKLAMCVFTARDGVYDFVQSEFIPNRWHWQSEQMFHFHGYYRLALIPPMAYSNLNLVLHPMS